MGRKKKPKEVSFQMGRERFHKLTAVSKAAGTDKARAVLCTVLLEVGPREIRAWATDSFQMVTRRFDPPEPNNGSSVTVGVSAELLLDAYREFKKHKGQTVLLEVVHETHLRIHLPERVVELPHVEGQYPNYRTVVQGALDKPAMKRRLVFSPFVLEKLGLGLGMDKKEGGRFGHAMEVVGIGGDLDPLFAGLANDNDAWGMFMPVRLP